MTIVEQPSDQWIADRTDKFAHGYVPTYRRIARQLGLSAAVCEIGTWRGGSLEVWREMFPAGLIVGVDIDPHAVWPDGTVKVVSDQASPNLPGELTDVLHRGGRTAFDMIVDDAGHNGVLSAETFRLTWPLVRPGGFWVLEDWFVGLPEMQYLGFGPSMLRLAESFLSLLTETGDVEDIHYRHALAVLRKKA